MLSILIIDSPMLTHLNFWTMPYGSLSAQDEFQAEKHHLWTVDLQSNTPLLCTVRLIFTLSTVAVLEPAFKSAMCNPDWPWICHPRLFRASKLDVGSSDGANSALYHQFLLRWVTQTPLAIIPQDLWERCWSRQPYTFENWGEVYGDLDKLQRIMEEEHADSKRNLAEELEAQGVETIPTSDSYWETDDDLYWGDEGDGDDEPLDKRNADMTLSATIELRTSWLEVWQDGQTLYEGQTGEQPQQVSGEQIEHEGEGEMCHP